jgi:ABC-2 type transport system permease protein
MAMFQQQGQPKGDIEQLWNTLGVELITSGGQPTFGGSGPSPVVVWQDYNPHPKLELPSQFVFVDQSLASIGGGLAALNPESPVTAGLQEMLFPFPGGLRTKEKISVSFSPLARTGTRSGTIDVSAILGNQGDPRMLQAFEQPGQEAMVLAASVERDATIPVAPEGDAVPATDGKSIKAIVVTDIDLLDGRIFGLRDRPDEFFALDFDNVTFVLNILDSLSGDDRFIEIRKRKPVHRTLERIEAAVDDAREQADQERQKFMAEFEQAEQEANAKMREDVSSFEEKVRDMESGGNAGSQELVAAMQQLASQQRLAQRRLDTKIEGLRRKRDAEVEAVERRLGAAVRREQDRQKWLAVLLPPIPPLVVAFFVFFRRRAREREGVSKSRLR